MRHRSKRALLQGLTVILGVATTPTLFADDVVRPRPPEWANLVPGGQFKDLFLPMPVRGGLTSDTWGGDNVKPRDVTNGIEDPSWSYWGGDPIRDENGRYHLFVACWPENHPRGHFGYFDSIIGRAVADDPMGPYVYEQTLGPGHNPDIYRTRQGEYRVYSTYGHFFYAKELTGPWKMGTYQFDKRGRYAFKNFVNFSFVHRPDRSMIAVSRRGYIWASEDGAENWYEVSAESVYPKVAGIFEDPVMWRDEVQYHIIVNDWKGRIAYYLRSPDGFHWKTDPGEAYAPGIARYEDGTVSDWYKFERIRLLQDEHGRPLQAHFAVIDTDKHSDLPNDNHNSKHIIIPLTVARLIALEDDTPITTATGEIRVRLRAEDGFDPHRDADLTSLRFGAAEEVNYGRGCRLVRTERAGRDAILVFDAAGHGFTQNNFAGKLLGRTTDGKILFGWCRLPGVETSVPLLSPLAPVFEPTSEGFDAYVEVQNFGEKRSRAARVKILLGGKDSDEIVATGKVRSLDPFEKSIARLTCSRILKPDAEVEVTVAVDLAGRPQETFTTRVRVPTR